MSVNPKFYLKNPTHEKSLIYMGIKINTNELFKYSTSCKINPELFDKKIKRPTTDKTLIDEYSKNDSNIKPLLKHILAELNNLEKSANQIIGELIRFTGEIKSTELRIRLDEIYNSHRIKANKKTSETFNSYLKNFISKIENGEKLHKNMRYEYNTIKAYKTFNNIINAFNSAIAFEEINIKFYEKFVKHLTDNNYSQNTIGKDIKFIKIIMRDALERGYHNNNAYSFREFKSFNVEVDNVYLTESELNSISKLDLSDKPQLEIHRDILIIGSYTGLRISDLKRIERKNIKKKNGLYLLEIFTKKTKATAIIPIKPIVFKILEKHDFNIPKISEQKLNLNIKKICKMADINEQIEKQEIKGGKTIFTSLPKYDRVSIHTCRRTFCTLMYLAGVPTIDIRAISGHKTETTFLNYIKVTKSQTAERLANNPFFK